MKSRSTSSTRGRPRAFNADAALDCATGVFWRQGYEGTSLRDLTQAMGINRPSLYAAFGNKESLFRKALDRYIERFNCRIQNAMEAPTARESVERLLRFAAEGAAPKPNTPKGCLLIGGALACSESADSIRRELVSRRHGLEDAIRQRLEKGICDGDVSSEMDVAALAKFYATVMHGMAVQTASDATLEELQSVVDAALRAWPAKRRGSR